MESTIVFMGLSGESGFPAGESRSRAKMLEVIRVPGWSAPGLDWLVHGFSTRAGGRTKIYRQQPADRRRDLNLGFTVSDDPEIVTGNRRLFLRAVCGRGRDFDLATLSQIHSSLIRNAPAGGSGVRPAVPPLKGDGWMTANSGILLGIQTADCLPILMADRRNRAVAAFHAGWRGTLGRIVEKGIGGMRLQFGSRPEDLMAAIGPGIGQCCYAVGDEVRQEFDSQFGYAADLFREVSDSDAIRRRYPLLFLTARAPGHSSLGPEIHLDLAEANRRQMLAAGLPPDAIYLSPECTSCRTERFFSHRAENGFTGRMMSVIGVRPPKG